MSVVQLDRHDRSSEALPAAALPAFHETRDPRTMCAAGGHQHVLEGLLDLATCGRSGIGLLTGIPGLGKTLIRSALAQRAAAEHCEVVSLETSLLSFDEVLLEILSQVRHERVMPADLPTRYERMAELKAALITHIVARGRHLLILVDDAEQLDTGMLDAIGALNNLCSERQAYVVPILFGHDTLRQKLERSPALRQRIGAHYTLNPLTATQCAAYVEHRLTLLGRTTADVFEPASIARLHAATGGVPRLVNALCRHAIRAAAQRGDARVLPTTIDECRRFVLDAGSPAPLSPLQIGH
jgi:general secretion pathway protein A